MIVPKSRQAEVLDCNHSRPGVGHFGVNKTLKRVLQSFYWGTCRRHVESFCLSCDPCIARKGPTGQSRAPLQQYQVGALSPAHLMAIAMWLWPWTILLSGQKPMLCLTRRRPLFVKF